MTQEENGLTRFQAGLSAAMVREIESWKGDEHLSKLHDSLQAHSDERTFLNACAEAMVARHMLQHGCELRFEVPTPSGKQCDFEVTRNGERFFLHIKRVTIDRPRRRRITVSSRLRLLERVERPYIVNIRWHEGLTDAQLQHIVFQGEQFLKHARLGDEFLIRDPKTNREIGGLQVLAPWEGTHVSLAIGLPTGFIDETPRFRKLMRRAYQQFMPRETNVILVCSSHDEDARDVETALLGSHIERWDRYPQRGKRIAHGRDSDGFWFEQRHDQSHYAGWFRFALQDDDFHSHLWLRDEADRSSAIGRQVAALFGGERSPSGRG